MKQELDKVEDAIGAIAAGGMVVVVDDEDRENEGDLIMAASKASPAQIAFMIRHTSGILCVPLEHRRARRLGLQHMVQENDAPMRTAFTVSVDYRYGLTTGVSAEERCNTILALANDNVGNDDFVRPGHVFPLISRDGGVLIRSGHTEAATDLARLAGISPVGLLAEIVNDDGTVKRLPELLRFAAEHGFRIISIADLITYRQNRERLVKRVHAFELQTSIGKARACIYRASFDRLEHLALVFGEHLADPTLVRIHRARLLDDVFGSQSGHEHSLINTALKAIDQEGSGVLLYLRAEESEIERGSSDTRALKPWREIGLGAQILRDLGIAKIRLLAGREHYYVGIRGFGIELSAIEKLD